jgi:acyl-CoA reductase-like NAD-dependent aldehyde dehydrogenase
MSASELPFAPESAQVRRAQAEWAQRSVRARLQPVRAFRHLLAQHAHDLAAAVQADVGRVPNEVLTTDVLPSCDAAAYLERVAVRALAPERIALSTRPLWLWGSYDTVYRRPWGVVAILGTWNYPLFLNVVPLLHALTAGNGVLWKPSELASTSARRLHELLLQAGYPPELVQLLPATRAAGPQVAEADIDYLLFVGSAAVGRKLATRLGERLIPSTLELSGCDAQIVLADADLDLAANAAWFGVTLNGGQTCLAVRRIIVEKKCYADFLHRLEPRLTAATPVQLALASQAQQAEQLIANALKHGARLLGATTPPTADDQRFRPTIVADGTADLALCREAAFAPIAAILPARDADDAVRLCQASPYALGASIFTRDVHAAEALAERLPSGAITINDVIGPTAHPATPFGGRGASGWGVTQGVEGLRSLTMPQAVSRRSDRFRPHYDLSAAGAERMLRLTEGLLRYSHGNRLGTRLSGLWQTIRGLFG